MPGSEKAWVREGRGQRRWPDDKEPAILREDHFRWRELQVQRPWGANVLSEGQREANVAGARWAMEWETGEDLERMAEVLGNEEFRFYNTTAIKLNSSKTELLLFFPKLGSPRFWDLECSPAPVNDSALTSLSYGLSGSPLPPSQLRLLYALASK